MTPLLQVVQPSSQAYLTTLETVKLELGITGNDEDNYLLSQIERQSAVITTYLQVPAASDGTRTLALETLRQNFRCDEDIFMLARVPVVSVLTVTDSGGNTFDSAEYEYDGATGFLYRVTTGSPNTYTSWGVFNIVTFQAGYILPGESTRTLPYDIEDAAISLVKTARASRTRDPLIKSVDVFQIQRTDYWVGGSGGSVSTAHLPPDVAAKLDPYRYLAI